MGRCFPDDWLVALWGEDPPIQRCIVHQHRNLPAHAPRHMQDEPSVDCRDMICANTAAEIETRRKAFLGKWRLKCKAVADSIEGEGGPWPRCGRASPLNGGRLFSFTRLDPSQWKLARTTNAIERLNEEFRRRIKTRTRASSSRNRADAALGPDGLRPDPDAQGRWLGNPFSAPRTDAA